MLGLFSWCPKTDFKQFLVEKYLKDETQLHQNIKKTLFDLIMLKQIIDTYLKLTRNHRLVKFNQILIRLSENDQLLSSSGQKAIF